MAAAVLLVAVAVVVAAVARAVAGVSRLVLVAVACAIAVVDAVLRASGLPVITGVTLVPGSVRRVTTATVGRVALGVGLAGALPVAMAVAGQRVANRERQAEGEQP